MSKELEYIIKRKIKIGKKINRDQNLFEESGEFRSSDKQWFGWLEESETLEGIETDLKELEFIKKCLYVGSSGAIAITSFGFDNIDKLKEVLK